MGPIYNYKVELYSVQELVHQKSHMTIFLNSDWLSAFLLLMTTNQQCFNELHFCITYPGGDSIEKF